MKKLIALAALLLAAVCAYSLEYGGIADNLTSIRIASNDWQHPRLGDTATLTANVRSPLAKDDSMYIAAEGFFRYAFSDTLGTQAESAVHQLILDASLLKFGATFRQSAARTVTLSAGRFTTSDDTALIFSQAMDGAQVQYRAERYNAQATLGYTGLLNAKTTFMIGADGAVSSYDPAKLFYELSAPNLIAEAKAALPYLFANQSLSAQVLGAFDLSGADDAATRMYATLTLSGPLAPTLFYSAQTTLETKDFSTLANLTDIQLTYYPPFKSMQVKAGLTYASGANLGFLSPFTGITSIAAVQSFPSQSWSGILRAGLQASIKPVQQLLCQASLDLVFGCMTSFSYDGIQLAASARYQLFSDVLLSLNASTYIAASETKDSTQISLKATISF